MKSFRSLLLITWLNEKLFTNLNLQFMAVFTGIAISYLVKMLFWFTVSFFLTKIEYGYLSYFISLSVFFSLFTLLGMGRLVLIKGNQDPGLFFTAIGIICITSIFISFLLVPLSVITWLYLFSLAIRRILLSYVLANQEYRIYMSLEIVQSITLLFLFLPLTLSSSYTGSITSLMLSNLTSYPVILFSKSFRLKTSFKFRLDLVKLHKRFLLLSILVGLLETITTATDRLVIDFLFGIESLAEYQFTSQALNAMNLITLVGYSYIQPKKTHGEQTRKIERFIILFAMIGLLIAFVVYPLLVNFLLPIYVETVLLGFFLFPNIIPRTLLMIKRAECYADNKIGIFIVSAMIMSFLYLLGLFLIKLAFSSKGLFLIGLSMLIATTSQYLILKFSLKSSK